MSIASVSNVTIPTASSGNSKKAAESIEQLAAEGDPMAIAELKLEHPDQNSAQPSGPKEAGKGEHFDQYV